MVVAHAHLPPELGRPPVNLRRVRNHIVESNKAARTDERRIRLEILPDALVGVVAVDEQEINRDAVEDPDEDVHCRPVVRISLEETGVLPRLRVAAEQRQVRRGPVTRVRKVDADQQRVRRRSLTPGVEAAAAGGTDLDDSGRAGFFYEVDQAGELAPFLDRPPADASACDRLRSSRRP